MTTEIVPRLAATIEHRRKQLGYSPKAFAEATGLSLTGLAAVRRGERKQYQARLTGPVTKVLGWTPDSIERLLGDKPPIPVHSMPDDPPEAYPLRVQHAQLNAEVAEILERTGPITMKGNVSSHPEATTELRAIADKMEKITWQIKQLRGEAPIPPEREPIDPATGLPESAMRSARSPVLRGRASQLQMDRLSSRIDELEALVRSQAQDIAYLLGRAEADDSDEQLGFGAPTPDAPQPQSGEA